MVACSVACSTVCFSFTVFFCYFYVGFLSLRFLTTFQAPADLLVFPFFLLFLARLSCRLFSSPALCAPISPSPTTAPAPRAPPPEGTPKFPVKGLVRGCAASRHIILSIA